MELVPQAIEPTLKTRDIRAATQVTDAYRVVREAARDRQGTRNDLKQNIQELIPESEPAPKTRDIRARYPGAAPPPR